MCASYKPVKSITESLGNVDFFQDMTIKFDERDTPELASIGSKCPVINHDKELVGLNFGVTPFNKVIGVARVEGVLSNTTALWSDWKRCVLLAHGFMENNKYIYKQSPMVLAGLYKGNNFVLLTQDSKHHNTLSKIHRRMPVIFPKKGGFPALQHWICGITPTTKFKGFFQENKYSEKVGILSKV